MERRPDDGFAREEFVSRDPSREENFPRKTGHSKAGYVEAKGRKERLRREAQNLREMLLNKEKELLELGEQEEA